MGPTDNSEHQRDTKKVQGGYGEGGKRGKERERERNEKQTDDGEGQLVIVIIKLLDFLLHLIQEQI